ncbi:MAG TPA: DUF2505 domain-containing protein [Polyangiaceae bacterium LLY-WYZ-15_(1-7)]|nr:hypothetical protein [Myxococcales bacterium]MAT23494.1 hypothetical protein [Sandaracinus sp.]HJK94892.1 DUF2505 domain-containing protein [Polyangiaceae bacterium LLY-WYZ-15_(1-7)]MBJ73238.1 hypothetical protein [Sandaracinus sp.]HJL02690.1 DUF2505 domain-containing protein [Polyangiaceae bacterium LLY-WYZ-15_(1-7)]
MKTFTMRHDVDCTVDEFWEIIHFGNFNHAMYEDLLGYEYEVIEDDFDSGVRKTHIVPHVDAPKVLVKALGDTVSFEEHGQLHKSDDGSHRYEFNVVPGVFPKKISIAGEMVIEPKGDKAVRVVDFRIGCSIFGIGKIFESFVAKEIQQNYERSAKFTNEYLARKRAEG